MGTHFLKMAIFQSSRNVNFPKVQYFQDPRCLEWIVFQYMCTHRFLEWIVFQYMCTHRSSEWIVFQYFAIVALFWLNFNVKSYFSEIKAPAGRFPKGVLSKNLPP